MPRRGIQPFYRVQIVALLSAGHTQQDVADRLNVTQSGVSKVWRKYRETGNVNDRPRSGRTRTATPIQNSYLQLSARRHPTSTARHIGYDFARATGMRISDQQCVEDCIRVVFIPVLHWTNGTEVIAGTGLLLINIGPLQNGGMSCLLTRPGLVWDRTLDVLGFGKALEDTKNTDMFRKYIRLQLEVNVLGGNTDGTADPSNSHLRHFDWSPNTSTRSYRQLYGPTDLTPVTTSS